MEDRREQLVQQLNESSMALEPVIQLLETKEVKEDISKYANRSEALRASLTQRGVSCGAAKKKKSGQKKQKKRVQSTINQFGNGSLFPLHFLTVQRRDARHSARLRQALLSNWTVRAGM